MKDTMLTRAVFLALGMLISLGIFVIVDAYAEDTIIIHDASTPLFVHPQSTCTSSLTTTDTGNLQEIFCNGDKLILEDVSTVTQKHKEFVALEAELSRTEKILDNLVNALMALLGESG